MKNIKDWVLGKMTFWVCLVISIALLVAGFIAPPTGKVDPSVLTAVGEIFAFATLAVVGDAIMKGYDTQIKKGELEVTIKKNEQELHS